jgi:transcriptional regulator with XRE-family HTH domain
MNAEQTIRLAEIRRLAASGEAKAIREHADLSLREVANAVRMSPSGLYRWENGERTPHGHAAVRYAEFLEQLTARRAS